MLHLQLAYINQTVKWPTFDLEWLSDGGQVCHLPLHHFSPVEMQRLLGTSEAFTSFLHGFIEGGVRPAQSHTEVSCPAHTCHSATDRACSAAEVIMLPKPATAEIVSLHVKVARIPSAS